MRVGTVIAHPRISSEAIDGAFARKENANGAAAIENGAKIKNDNFDKRRCESRKLNISLYTWGLLSRQFKIRTS
jgi:hypothetical protein